MADLSFYKFLEAAFRHKIYKNPAASSFNYLGYNLPFETRGAEKGVFEYARKILPKFYTSEFSDTKEGNLQMAKKVLEKLERKEDSELVQQFEGFNATEDALAIQEAKAQSEAAAKEAAIGEPAGTMAGGNIGRFGLPSGGASMSSGHGRIIHVVPSVHPEAESKIVIANKSGVPIETNPPSKLILANSSGVPIGPSETPKIVLTNKGGIPTDEYTIKSAPSPKRLNSSALRSSVSSIGKSAKNSVSRLGPGFKVGSTRIANGLGNFFKGAGRAGGNLLGGAIGGGGNALGRFGLKTVDFGARLFNQSGGKFKFSASKKVGSRIMLLLLGLFILFGFFAGITGGLNPEGIPVPGTPITGADISQCKFTRAGSSAPIKSSTLRNWVSETSARENIPVGIMASVTMHENPDFVSNADDEHDAIKNNYYYRVSRVNEGTNRDTNAIGLFQISVGKTPTDNGLVDHCEALFSSGILNRAAEKQGKRVEDKSYYCVADLDERVKRFCQTDRIERNRTYGIPDKPYNESVINLCNLKDNIVVGAEFLKAMIGNNSWDDSNSLRNAIKGFYGACSYPGGDYCAEVASDYISCKATPTPGSTSGDLAGVIQWAERINAALERGTSAANRMVANISNGTYSAVIRTAKIDEGVTSPDGIYWCTNIVIDSYNLAGITGLSTNKHQGVRNMMQFWQATPNYQFVAYNGLDSLKKIKPGFALFRVNPGTYRFDHVSIVHKIDLPDDRGNGSIKTLDSNGIKEWSATIREGRIVETGFTAPVVGFGGHAEATSTPQVDSLSEVFTNLPGNHSALAILPNGQRIQKNADKAIPAYSVIKLWIAATVLEAASKGEFDLSEEYIVQAGDIAAGTGNLNSSSAGKSYTYQQLMEFMLIYSDNSSSNILLKKLGPGGFGFIAVNSYAQRNNYSATKIQRFLGSLDATNDNFTSATDGAIFMDRLYKKQIVNSEASDNLIGILNRRKDLENKAYIYIGHSLPSGTEFTEKSGVGPKTRGDVGSFVTKDGQRVSLAILLSNLTSESAGEAAIAKSALDIYNLAR